jgi:hypothetical protein
MFYYHVLQAYSYRNTGATKLKLTVKEAMPQHKLHNNVIIIKNYMETLLMHAFD